jgi:hypothetical protein
MTDLKDAPALDKRDNAQHPILPATQRDRGCHQVVGKGKGVIKQIKEKAQEGTHPIKKGFG